MEKNAFCFGLNGGPEQKYLWKMLADELKLCLVHMSAFIEKTSWFVGWLVVWLVD